jgi:Rod binding domain-containing protein
MKITLDSNSSSLNDSETRTRSKLTDAAEQFEAMLLREMLKPMRSEKGGWTGEEQADGATDTINSFGCEAVAKAISRNGGLGIARQVVRQVSAEGLKTQKEHDRY